MSAIGRPKSPLVLTEEERAVLERWSRRGRTAQSLALRSKSPIYVARKVLEASSALQQSEASADNNLSNISPDKWSEILEKMSPDDFKYKM